MSLTDHDDVLPECEPIPWDLEGEEADAQERGFLTRALQPIA